MRLPRNIDKALLIATVFLIAFAFSAKIATEVKRTYAAEEDGVYVESEEHFVSFYDDGEKLIVKTNALTVGEALDRAGIEVSKSDIVEPAKETLINGDNFFVNIYRARPAVVKVGNLEKYIMTASYDSKTVAKEAGVTVYDGDEITLVPNTNFLEMGVANVYEVKRNGGRTITVETEIPFPEQEVRDFNLAAGTREVRQYGEVGSSVAVYEVMYVDGVEVSRELKSETLVRNPVARIVAVGARKSISPETSACAAWVKEAGVSDGDLPLAIDLIYHESGCRVDATNASSGAYGIPQALPGEKMATSGADWETNPVTQIRWMIKYVTGKYGGWAGALDWWYEHGWY